jgi:hypothetical protein
MTREEFQHDNNRLSRDTILWDRIDGLIKHAANFQAHEPPQPHDPACLYHETAAPPVNRREPIYAEICCQCDENRKQRGGDSHDDQYTPDDWLLFIQKQVQLAHSKTGRVRSRFVKIGSLVFDALESLARQEEAEKATPAASPEVEAAQKAGRCRVCWGEIEGTTTGSNPLHIGNPAGTEHAHLACLSALAAEPRIGFYRAVSSYLQILPGKRFRWFPTKDDYWMPLNYQRALGLLCEPTRTDWRPTEADMETAVEGYEK